MDQFCFSLDLTLHIAMMVYIPSWFEADETAFYVRLVLCSKATTCLGPVTQRFQPCYLSVDGVSKAWYGLGFGHMMTTPNVLRRKWPREQVLRLARERARSLHRAHFVKLQRMLDALVKEAGWTDKEFLDVFIDDVSTEPVADHGRRRVARRACR